jgi:hypothetical protein
MMMGSEMQNALQIAIEYIEELLGSDRDDDATLRYLKDVYNENCLQK